VRGDAVLSLRRVVDQHQARQMADEAVCLGQRRSLLLQHVGNGKRCGDRTDVAGIIGIGAGAFRDGRRCRPCRVRVTPPGRHVHARHASGGGDEGAVDHGLNDMAMAHRRQRGQNGACRSRPGYDEELATGERGQAPSAGPTASPPCPAGQTPENG
jgi:hypothetical protein